MSTFQNYLNRFPVPSQPRGVADDLGTLLPDLAVVPRGTVMRSPLSDPQLGAVARGEIGVDAIGDPRLRQAVGAVQANDPMRWQRVKQTFAAPPVAPPPDFVAGPQQAAQPVQQPVISEKRRSGYLGQSDATRQINATNLFEKAAGGNVKARERLRNLAENFGDPFAQQAMAQLPVQDEVAGLGRVPTLGGSPVVGGPRFAAPPPTGFQQAGMPVAQVPTVMGVNSGVDIPDAQALSFEDWSAATTPEQRAAVMGEIMASGDRAAMRQLEGWRRAMIANGGDRTMTPRERQMAEDRIQAEMQSMLYGYVRSGALHASAAVERRRRQMEQEQLQQQLDTRRMLADDDEQRMVAREGRQQQYASQRERSNREYDAQQLTEKRKYDEAKRLEDERRKADEEAREERKSDMDRQQARRRDDREDFARLVAEQMKGIDPNLSGKVDEDGKAVPMTEAEVRSEAIKRARELQRIAREEYPDEVEQPVGGRQDTDPLSSSTGSAPVSKNDMSIRPVEFVEFGGQSVPMRRVRNAAEAEALPVGTFYLDHKKRIWQR